MAIIGTAALEATFALLAKPPTPAQETALKTLCERYGVDYDPEHYKPAFDLPKTWVAGWVGGPAARKLYVGCSPEGRISS